jgi:hypothetical protein
MSPVFEYQPYHAPYVSTIADLIRAPGEAQAQAALESGRAWAGAAQGVGQAVTGAIQQATDPRRKVEAMQLEEGQLGIDKQKRDLAAQKALDDAFAGAVKPGADGQPQFDAQALVSHLPGHLVPGVMQSIQQINDAALKLQETKGKLTQQNIDLAAGLLNGVKASGYDSASFLRAIRTARDTGLMSPDEALQHAGGAIEQGDGYIRQVTDSYLAKSQEWQKVANETLSAQARATQAKTGAQRLELEAPKLQAETQKTEAELAGTLPATPTQQAAITQGAARVAQGAERNAIARDRETRERTQGQLSDAQRGVALRNKGSALFEAEKQFRKDIELIPRGKRTSDDQAIYDDALQALNKRKLEVENTYRAQLRLDPLDQLGPEWNAQQPGGAATAPASTQTPAAMTPSPAQRAPVKAAGASKFTDPTMRQKARDTLTAHRYDASDAAIEAFLAKPTNRAQLGYR